MSIFKFVSYCLLSVLFISNVFATNEIDLSNSKANVTRPEVVKGRMEYTFHTPDIFTMNFVVTVRFKCLLSDVQLTADNFISFYGDRGVDNSANVNLFLVSNQDFNMCSSDDSTEVEYVVRSKDNTTNFASAPSAIVVNGLTIPVDPR